LISFLDHHQLTDLRVEAGAVDRMLVEYFDYLLMQGKDPASGRKIMSAIEFYQAEFATRGSLTLPRARKALRGWQRLVPVNTKDPLPWPTCTLVSRRLVELNHSGHGFGLALFWLTMVDTLGRPGEVIRLMASHILRPSKSMPQVTVLLNAAVARRASKVGEMDETVSVSREWLGRLLVRYADRRGSRPLWDFDMKIARDAIQAVATEQGLNKYRLVLYTARHSGASIDRYEDRFDQAELQKRGRWRHAANLRRYEKRGILQKVWNDLPPRVREASLRAAASIETWLPAHCPRM